MTRLRSSLACLAAAATLVTHAAGADAAPIRECGSGLGGSYKNLTVRALSCPAGRRAAPRVTHDVRACWPTERVLGTCGYRVGPWSVRGKWFRDRYGSEQLDLQAAASGGRVVRLQTDWDGA